MPRAGFKPVSLYLAGVVMVGAFGQQSEFTQGRTVKIAAL
jgi:hypothetical protein